jgi:serine protease AprX
MAFIRPLLCFFLFASTMIVTAQVNRYMVLFKDKNGTPYSVSNASQFLSEKAIARRIKQGVNVTELDLPVNPDYVHGVHATGADVFFRSRWFNGVLVQCDASLIPAIQSLEYVDTVEFVAPQARLTVNSGGRTRFNIFRKKTTKEGYTDKQLNLSGLNYMHDEGIEGEGMTMALLDAGFPGVDTINAFEHLFANSQVNTAVSFDFVHNTNNVFRYDAHGTEVLSTIAAEVPGSFEGGAPQAQFQLYVTEDAPTEYRIEEYNWDFAAERADSAGVDIISSSLGYYDFDDNSMSYTKAQMDGKTAVCTRAAQYAADRGIVVVVSAGNEGNIASWRIITAPADAKDVLAVANVDQNGVRSNSSSIGPSADQRIKPDVAALGTGVKVINDAGTLSSASGTSLAAPLIASLVAGVWQHYPELTNLEVIDLIRHGASQGSHPDNSIGYGIPNFKLLESFHDHGVTGTSAPAGLAFKLFPNPAKDTIVITLADNNPADDLTFELFTSDGKPLGTDAVRFDELNNVYQANLSSLSAGLYFLKIVHDGKRYVYKLVKE